MEFKTKHAYVLFGNALQRLKEIPDESVHCCVTSPPYYGLRSYLPDEHPDKVDEIGLEQSPKDYINNLVMIFREIRRILRPDGSVWVNIGDCYVAGKGTASPTTTDSKALLKEMNVKPKDLLGIPWMLAFALRDDGWYLRQEVIWSKVSAMPESVTDRFTKAHEQVFLLTKNAKYFFDNEAVKEKAVSNKKGSRVFGSKEQVGTLRNDIGREFVDNGKRNKRSVWHIAPESYSGAHFAVMPKKLVEPCILAGTSEKGCCSVCGNPIVRLTERQVATSKSCPKTEEAHKARGGQGEPSGTVGKSGSGRVDGYTITVGWEPTCSCGKGISPCKVIDPFAGSGTVGEVALKFGRDFVGIELNGEYYSLIEKRLQEAELVASMKTVSYEELEME
jgi:DNA modification methylase